MATGGQNEYGGVYITYQCYPGSEFIEKKTNSRYVVGSLSENDLSFCHGVDLFYCDPPWNLGITKTFYKQADQQYSLDFTAFLDSFFHAISFISPKIAFIEMGKQFADDTQVRLQKLFPVVQRWEGTYYRKNPVVYLRGGTTPSSIVLNGVDDSKSPQLAIQHENLSSVCDLCIGLGATPLAAFKLGKRFVGLELNHKRMARALVAVEKAGGIIEKIK